MQLNNTSVIVFDLGNVLLPFDYKPAIERINKIEAGLGDKFMRYYKEHYKIHRDFESGKITETDFIKKMLEVLNHKIDGNTFCRYYSEIFTENKDVASLLPGLKKHYKLLLLSNTNSIHQKYGWQKYNFIKYFDHLILSHEVKAVKPERKIFSAAESASGKPPKEHLFIDDIKEYADAAISFGWEGIQFKGYENLVDQLKKRKILLQ